MVEQRKKVTRRKSLFQDGNLKRDEICHPYLESVDPTPREEV